MFLAGEPHCKMRTHAQRANVRAAHNGTINQNKQLHDLSCHVVASSVRAGEPVVRGLEQVGLHAGACDAHSHDAEPIACGARRS